MAEERADLRQGERERIARRKSRPGIGRLDGLRGKQPPVDRGQNLALDRQPGAQGLDGRLAAGGPLEMDDECLGRAQDWPSLQRPDIAPARGAGGFYRAAPPRVIPCRGDPPIDLDA